MSRESSEPKAAATDLATFIHSPTLASVNPASHQGFVFWSYEIVERATHDGSGWEDAIIGTILNVAAHGEAIEDEESSRGLSGKIGITRGSIGKYIICGKRP